MLPEFFANIDLDDAVSNEEVVDFCTPDKYTAKNHYAGWFLDQQLPLEEGRRTDENRELRNHKAAYFCHHERFDEALKEYCALFSDYKQNRVHSLAVVESIIRCGMKIPSYPLDNLLSYLHEYEQRVVDFGDQLQYLTLKKDIYARIPGIDADRTFIDTVCLLCVLVDLPEHWLAFEQKHIQAGGNFQLGYLTRALLLLERHISQANGFVKRVMQRRLDMVNERVMDLACSSQRIYESRKAMDVNMTWLGNNSESNDALEGPVHDCRSKIEIIRTAEEQSVIVEQFKKQFSWMFDGCCL